MKKEQYLKEVGQYLKEVGCSFLLQNKISSSVAERFMLKLIDKIGMTVVNCNINEFRNGGFDVVYTIKESIVYFGYWEENDYVRLFCSSCKNFDESIIIYKIKQYFKLKSKIRMTIINDITIKEEVENLCLERY